MTGAFVTFDLGLACEADRFSQLARSAQLAQTALRFVAIAGRVESSR